MQTKPCTFCGESILASAMKCRYCHEIVDQGLRVAIEAKDMALRAHERNNSSQPIVVSNNNNNNNNNNGWRSRARRRHPWDILVSGLVCWGLFVIAMISTSLTDPTNWTWQPTVAVLSFLLGVILVPVGLIVGLVRIMR